jgi:hypothetical protein
MLKSTSDIPIDIHELQIIAPLAINHHHTLLRHRLPLTNTINHPCTKEPIMFGTHLDLLPPPPLPTPAYWKPPPSNRKEKPEADSWDFRTNLSLSMKLSQGQIFVLVLNFGIKLQAFMSKHSFYSNYFFFIF